MDILNFISWIKGKRQVTTVDPTKTLIPVGLKDGRRDDDYLAGAITVQDLAAQIAPQPTYKVYTALLTQSGGDDVTSISFDQPGGAYLTIGVTYMIADSQGGDWTNVGAPNNNVGTYFVATGTTPNSWGGGTLDYNTGAPVATVLENTIGNIWFTCNGIGAYSVNSNVLFTSNKTTLNINLMGDDLSAEGVCLGAINTNSELTIITGNATTQSDNVLYWSTPIEIRVYN
jgi:hypothetical protein